MNLLQRFKGAYYGFKSPLIEQESNITLSILKPCMRFITNSIEKQTVHINEEVLEIIDALVQQDYDHAMEETIDTIQSCITALEIYRRQGYDVETAIEKVFMKNNGPDRNYYYEQAGVKNPDLYICGKCENAVCKYSWLAMAGKA